MVLPLSIVLLCANLVSLSRPRTCLVSEAKTVKLLANMLAVILRQSVQLQTKVPTKPGALVGYVMPLLACIEALQLLEFHVRREVALYHRNMWL